MLVEENWDFVDDGDVTCCGVGDTRALFIAENSAFCVEQESCLILDFLGDKEALR